MLAKRCHCFQFTIYLLEEARSDKRTVHAEYGNDLFRAPSSGCYDCIGVYYLLANPLVSYQTPTCNRLPLCDILLRWD
jgi:hypothetical protein